MRFSESIQSGRHQTRSLVLEEGRLDPYEKTEIDQPLYPRHVLKSPAATRLERAFRSHGQDAASMTCAEEVERTPIVSTSQMRQRMLQEVSEIHRSNVYRNLERRIQSARARGDNQLVSLLEKELQEIS